MATIFFPSCKVKAFFPEASKRMEEYLRTRFNLDVTGCCRENLQNLTKSDTAVCICNTCMAFCEESSEAKIVSVWELLAEDANFPFPDYKGEEIALQDCWRTYDNKAVQKAVRELMRKMNISIVELPDQQEKSLFCGRSLLMEMPPYYKEFAPKRFGRDVPDSLFTAHTDEERLALMKEHCAGIPTEKVVCYCVGCIDGIMHGGRRPVHLMDLLLSAAK